MSISSHYNDEQQERLNKSIASSLSCSWLCLGSLLARLVYLPVLVQAQLNIRLSQEKRECIFHIIKAPRGLIFDRNGKSAHPQPSVPYSIYVLPYQIEKPRVGDQQHSVNTGL